MIPFSPLNSYPPNRADREMILRFKKRMDNEFKEVKKFSFEDNYILIYKPKENHHKSHPLSQTITPNSKDKQNARRSPIPKNHAQKMN